MDDEVPSKMTHNELVDLNVKLKSCRLQMRDASYELMILKEKIEAALSIIEDKIIDNLALKP